MTDKIIFLDFDGVITNYESGFRLNPEKLMLLEQIIDATDCGLVISSAWRCNDLQTTIEDFSCNAILKSFNNGIVFPYFVMTDLWEGLSEKDVEKTIRILND